jgi:hypothetical protein
VGGSAPRPIRRGCFLPLCTTSSHYIESGRQGQALCEGFLVFRQRLTDPRESELWRAQVGQKFTCRSKPIGTVLNVEPEDRRKGGKEARPVTGDRNGRSGKTKPAGKPGSVVDSHSSGPWIAPGLKPPTRELGGSRHRSPIWCCSRWRLPRFTPQAACAAHGLVSVALFLALEASLAGSGVLPRPAPMKFAPYARAGVTRHRTLRSPDFPLSTERRFDPPVRPALSGCLASFATLLYRQADIGSRRRAAGLELHA